jgi:hypothetical protein
MTFQNFFLLSRSNPAKVHTSKKILLKSNPGTKSDIIEHGIRVDMLLALIYNSKERVATNLLCCRNSDPKSFNYVSNSGSPKEDDSV